MGELGKITRVSAPYFGAPFTFVAYSDEECTAPGQLSLIQMHQIRKSLTGTERC